MTKTIRKKFIMTSMISVTVLIFILVGAINVINIMILNIRSERSLQVVADKIAVEDNVHQVQINELVPFYPFLPSETSYKTFMPNYYIAYFNADDEILYTDIKHMPSIDENFAKNTANDILKSESESGTFEYFQYLVLCNQNGKTVICMDISGSLQSYLSVLVVSIGIGAICWLLMFAFVILLSKKTVAPIIEAFEKQSQFITNAGHELKTPIAIIQSNAEAMELYKGKNKWIINIKEQTLRLTELTKGMLFLARMDEKKEQYECEKIQLSDLLNNVLSNFAHQLRKKNINIDINIDENIETVNIFSLVEQLFYILIDNAVKYVDMNGSIAVILNQNQNSVIFSIKNTCSSLPNVPPDKLFDRFYKGDKSRNQRGGGYGIGLSIASSIATTIKSGIRADYIGENAVKFSVIFN